MIKFTPTAFRSNSSAVFNAVQSCGVIAIESKNRPDMILMLRDSHDAMVQTAIDQDEKIMQLTGLTKAQ